MQQTTPHNPITSKENSIVKYLRSLSDPKVRKQKHAFLIEGFKMVEEALREDLGITLVVATPDLVRHHGKGVLKLAEAKSAEICWISERLMHTISESKTPQPVLAVANIKEHAEEELFGHASKLIIMLHQLQDPGNLGTILRTAEAAGAAGVVLTSRTVDPFNAKSLRASMGSALRLPIVHIHSGDAFMQECRRRGFQTVATVLTGEKAHFDVDLTKPTLVILGQEGGGLPQEMTENVDWLVRIPMAETIESLNVGTAAAVILYEAVRQRSFK